MGEVGAKDMSRGWGAKLGTFLTLGGKKRAHLLRYPWRARAQ
jgi:hypothetical protein